LKGIGLNLEMVWLFLSLLGLTLYFIVQYSVVRVTRTPWWQLWLVLMIPAFVIAGWSLTHKSINAIPTPLLVGTFLISTVLYVFLIGRNPRPLPDAKSAKQLGESKSAKDQGAVSPLNRDEQAQLQNCFPWSVYYLKQIDLRPQAVICRGQLRAESEVAYQTIRQNVQAQFGDRFLVLFQAGAADQTYFALVTNPYAKAAEKLKGAASKPLNRPVLALGLLVLTVLTTTLAGLELTQPTLQPATLFKDPAILMSGLPYALPLIFILGIHELGHYFTAQFYKIKTTLPYFIPIPFAFGTFGAYIQMRTPAPSRKALFDVGLAGPLAGFIVTLPFLVWGLMHSDLTALPEKLGTMTRSAFDPRSAIFNPHFSIFFAGVSRLIFGQTLTHNLGIHLHPVAIAGWLGLIVTALNLMPFGQLDGGHIVHAMYGQVCRVLVLLLSFAQPFLLFWGILLLFMPAVDEPALNDVSELDSYRDTLGLLALGLLLLIILPVPSGLEPFFFGVKPTP
jgi:membrane-associated protease RseP (regulator of RpoE activity)